MKYNATFLKQKAIAIFSITIFVLAAITFVLPSYADEKVKMVEGIIDHVSDNNSITVRGQSYNVNKALIVGSKGVALDKRQLKSGLKVQIYMHGNIVEEIIVFDATVVE